jgi:hypothetical protein
VDEERQRIRRLAKSGKYTRHEIANMTGMRYDTVCEITQHINMFHQTNNARQSAAAFGRMRWDENREMTADQEERKLNYRDFHAVDAPAGSIEKVEALRRRFELRQPLWHPDDRVDYAGLTTIVRPSALSLLKE